MYPDLSDLCRQKLDSFIGEKHQIKNIHYFTAKVVDPQRQMRQHKYNSKLQESGVTIHYGKFVLQGGHLKEKRSDVNLAARFVYDACNDIFDYAVIISNDTDFCGAIDLVQNRYPNKIVDVWIVGTGSADLRKISKRHHKIWYADLQETRCFDINR